MRILVTNDDGVHAPGLAIAERIAGTLSDDVFVIAPEFEQSGVAHSLSLNDPLRLREISPRHYALKGTPTDCVIMGVRHLLLDHPPDLVLSGVNSGQNLAEDELVPQGIEGIVPYAGTVRKVMIQYCGGLRASLGYCGCRTIAELRQRGRFVRVSLAGVTEAHPHDVKILKEAPNYRSGSV